MLKRLCLLAIVLLVFGQGMVVTAQIAGQWEVKTMQGSSPSYHEMKVEQKEDGSLTATWNGDALKQFKFENNKLSFVRSMEMAGYEVMSRFTGTLADGKINGVLSSEMGDAKVVACPAQPMAAALGLWMLTWMRW